MSATANTTTLKVSTTHASPDGGSAFGAISFVLVPRAFAPPAPAFDISEPLPARSVTFFSVPVAWTGDWHPAPRNQLYVQTSGSLEVEVTTGEVRVLVPGDVLWTTDTTGTGHRSRVVGDVPACGLFIQLPEDIQAP